jgi:hypothetical protein
MYWQPYERERDTDPTFALIGADHLDAGEIAKLELTRAKGALGFLKAKIGNDGMRSLLADEIRESADRTTAWVEVADGQWRSGSLELVVPGPSAEAFHGFFMHLMRDDMQMELRAAHPDHFMNVPLGPRAEVIENVGEDDIPWFIGLEFTQDASRFPTSWDESYPERLGAIIRNADDVVIGSAMHEMKDAADGTHILLTITLPSAAPEHLVRGHLEHFAVEFSTWTRHARAAGLR